MKKYSLIFLILALAIAFSSCFLSDGTFEKETDETISPDSPVLRKESSKLSFYTEDECNDFYINAQIPWGFVRYHALTDHIGKFNGLGILEGADDLENALYVYSFLYDGYDFWVYIDHDPLNNEVDIQQSVISETPTNDMRHCSLGQSGTYEKDGIEWNYVNGNLQSIKWSYDEYLPIEVTLISTPGLYEYHGDNGLINDLLDKENATEAVDWFDYLRTPKWE